MGARLIVPAVVYAVIIGLSSVPADDLAAFPPALSYVGHAVEYAALGASLRWALGDVHAPTITAVVVTVALAGLDETYQSFVPGRDPSLVDWAVDVTAAAAAAALTHRTISGRR